MGLEILLIIIIIAILLKNNTTKVPYGLRYWNVVNLPDKHEAAKLLSDTNNIIIDFMRILKKKYRIDEPDNQHDDHHYRLINHPGDLYNIVGYMVSNYNPDSFYEKDPRIGAETSYTTNKGEKMHICLRSKTAPYEFVDKNTLIFVMLHEASHIANYNDWGHNAHFWEIFRFVLHEAVLAGIYTPVDYARSPVNYCGLNINYQVLYDNNVRKIWE